MGAGQLRRAADPGITVGDLAEVIWRRCPACDGPARVTTRTPDARLICTRCGHLLEGDRALFRTPPYLTATVAGEELWVFNIAHIDALSAWLGATLRERSLWSAGGIVNRTMMSRLPPWMKKAGNRPKILHALAKLRAKAVRERLT